MRQRHAAAALYVGRTPAGFAKEIGEWADGRCQSGPFVACVDGLLESALRYVVALVRLDDLQQAHREVDSAAIRPVTRFRPLLSVRSRASITTTSSRPTIDFDPKHTTTSPGWLSPPTCSTVAPTAFAQTWRR